MEKEGVDWYEDLGIYKNIEVERENGPRRSVAVANVAAIRSSIRSKSSMR